MLTWRDGLTEPGAALTVEPAYRGRHRATRRISRAVPRRPMTDWSLYFAHLEVALRHLGSVPVVFDGEALGVDPATVEPAPLMGPWDEARHPDEAWALADIDLADMREARRVVTS